VTIRNLDALFQPKAVLLVATGAAGRREILARNLAGGGFAGRLFEWHPKPPGQPGLTAVRHLAQLPVAPDLAVIDAPPERLPALIAKLGAAGTRAAVICGSAGDWDSAKGRRLWQAMLEASRPHLLRILGPDSLGVMVPGLGLNAGLAHLPPLPGKLALVAQSSAVVASVLDWARPRGIGFSRLVALGGMMDVDFGDLLDDLARDAETQAVLLYMENVSHARKFMSAARAAARTKPVIALKAGRFPESARGAPLDEGTQVSQDEVYHAALRRAGIVRVAHLDDLFEAATILAAGAAPRDPGLTILTNGGGMGVLAGDTLVRLGGQLAALPADTLAALAGALPPGMRAGNPVDLGDGAGAAHYARALEVLLSRPETGTLLVLYCPSALSRSMDCAQAVVDAARQHGRRTVLASWVGEETAAPARQLFAQNGIPSYPGPTQALRAFMHLVRYREGQEALMETPPSVPERFTPALERAQSQIRNALKSGREQLNADETLELLEAYEIPVHRDGPVPAWPDAFELVAGTVVDPVFGPLILFGHGGSATELLNDRALALPPLNLQLAQELMSRTRIWRLLRGYRGRRPASIDALALTLVKLAQLVADIPQIQSLELNPLLADHAGVRVVGARCRIAGTAAADRLAIRPYPKELEQDIVLGDGRKLLLRPIMPEDEPALRASFAKMTPEEIHLRFFAHMSTLSHSLAARLTQIDYDREMALVLTEHGRPGSADIYGSVRIVADPDHERAEFAILVRHDMSGLGLGAVLMRRIIDYARTRGIGELFGDVLAHNSDMLRLGKALGFRETHSPDDPELRRLTLPLRPQGGRAHA
jgi:acyl-CoA synthetase (NDP forming)/GNAT superfamily N-acetyltransferase